MNPKRSAFYPGTFDPITNGHQDLARRASGIFDRVVIGIAANPGKAPLFAPEARADLARRVLADLPNVTVICYAGLTVDLAREQGCGIVIRGLRAVSDSESEFQLANMSRHLAPDVDYVFLPSVVDREDVLDAVIEFPRQDIPDFISFAALSHVAIRFEHHEFFT